MKKRYIVLVVFSLCLLLVSGIWGGVKLAGHMTRRYEESRQKISTTVAVVNQDAGAVMGDAPVNYAETVIESMGAGYTLVSASAAQKGYENGVYGAIVTFPADFSANIVSINDKTPKQATLQFAINPKLPEERFIPLYIQLLEMQQQINNTVAYAYVLTIYEQLHSAQDEVDTLLTNDETDMDAVKKVTLGNYMDYLQLGDMPRGEFKPEQTDLQGFVDGAQSVADNINQVYVDSYQKAQEDFTAVRDAIDDHGNTLITKNAEWAYDMGELAGKMDVYSDKATKYQESVTDWSNTASGKLEEQVKAVDTYYRNLNDWRDNADSVLQALLDNKGTIANNVDEIRGIAETLSTRVGDYNTQVSNLGEWLRFLEDYKKYLDNLTSDLPDFPDGNPPTALQQIDGDIVALADALKNSLNLLLENAKADLTGLPNHELDWQEIEQLAANVPKLPNEVATFNVSDVPKKPVEIDTAMDGLTEAYAAYNPNSYLDKDTKEAADEKLKDFSSVISSAEGALQASEANNLAQLNAIYFDYNTHIGSLRQKIYETYTNEHANLTNSLAELSSTLENTSAVNHALLDSFVSRMPNSRQASTVNQKSVEGTVSPVAYSLNYIRNVQQYDPSGLVLRLVIIMALILLAILIDAIYLLVEWGRRKRRARR